MDWGLGITLLAGANGQGKTLFCRALLGLERTSAGRIEIDGNAWTEKLARENIGYVIQDPLRHFLGMTCEEEVSFGRRRIDSRALLEKAGLRGREEDPPLILSGGEQRRLALVAALAGKPRYLILDEPFNALDWDGVRRTLGFLLELKNSGISLLLITHDLEKCLAHIDSAALLANGKLLAQGAVPEVWPLWAKAGMHPPSCGPEGWLTQTWL